ncbi:MAG TPA: hypothetical protein VGJ77_01090 [Gaiellaceae bacterium]
MARPLRLVDEFDGGLGWMEEERIARTSHALVGEDGGVWLVDPVEPSDNLSQRLSGLGEVRGVIQLLDRHARDCALLAARFGVPHHAAFAGAADVPFDVVPVVSWWKWREAALWWPERRVLVCADALGTLGYFRAPGERIGVHPLLRLFPPKRLRAVEPQRILVGHGPGVHDGAAAALAEALRTSRRRLPAALVGRSRRTA